MTYPFQPIAQPPEATPVDNTEQEEEVQVLAEVPTPEPAEDDLSDLFEVPQGGDEEFKTDDLFELDPDKDVVDANENGDLSDLLEVSDADVMGEAPKPKRRMRQMRRTVKPYFVPPPTMGGTL